MNEAQRDPHITPTIVPPLKQIGPYEIVGFLGQGGMGAVYEARARSGICGTVAVKLIKTGCDSQEVLARFELERIALARMDHPNIAKILDDGMSETGRPYFVMEYVPGRPITRFADEERFTLRQRLELIAEVCIAIAHANSRGIIHRDIKPGNVLAFMQDGKPRVKVIDFGVAKAVAGDRWADAALTLHDGLPIGSYEYISPEQVEGSPPVDARSDVYSLGVLLYEMLTGLVPLDRLRLDDLSARALKRRLRKARRPHASDGLCAAGPNFVIKAAERRKIRPDRLIRLLRVRLEWIPAQAMRQDRDRRYTSAQQMAEDIQNYLTGRPMIARMESSVYRLNRYLASVTGRLKRFSPSSRYSAARE